MAYQPLYATITDTNGIRSSHSLRSRVEWLNLWLNSFFGTVMRVSTSYVEAPKVHIERKGKTLKEYRKQKEEAEQQLQEQEKVIVNIDIVPNKKFDVCINGVKIPLERLKILEQINEQKFNQQLELLKVLRGNGEKEKMLEIVKEVAR